MQYKLLGLLIKAKKVTTEHQKLAKISKNSITKPIFHNKNAKLQHKRIYDKTAYVQMKIFSQVLNLVAACTARNI